MKQDNKIFIIILSIITIILAVLLVYYFNMSKASFGFGNKNGTLNKIGNSSNNNTINSGKDPEYNVNPDEEIPTGKVTDYTEYFNVNNIINEYYSLISNENYEAILDIFDNDYIEKNNITKDNIESFLEKGYDNFTYFSKNMYRKGSKGIRYYFVIGELERYQFAEEILDEVEGISFMVTIDYNNSLYSITPLSKDTDLPSYASSYFMKKNKTLNSNSTNKYAENRYTDEMITSYYIAYYKNLLYLNTEKAYNMLDDSLKVTYPELKDFSAVLETMYNDVITNFLSYSVSGENGLRTYSANLSNSKKITMKESSIMNFKVSIK